MKVSSFIIILIIGILLRIFIIVFALQFRENTDILRWRDWGRITYLHSLQDTYTTKYLTFGTLPNNMPPGTLYISYSMYYTSLQFSKVMLKVLHAPEGSISWINSIIPNIFLRIPSFLADIALYILIYITIKKYRGKKYSVFGASLFYLNPVVLYNSAFWGQMDSINNLFFYLSSLFLLQKRVFTSILFLFLSLFVKLSLLFMVPFTILLLYIFTSSKRIISGLFFSVTSILLLILPISLHPHQWVTNYLTKNATGEMQNITAFAFNFWWFVFQPIIKIGAPFNNFEFSEIRLVNSPYSDTLYLGVPLAWWGYVVFLISVAPFFLVIIKNKVKNLTVDRIFLILSLITCIGFLTLPRMHERYLYPLFPLLATYCGLTHRFNKFYVFFSLLNILNLYIVWHPMLPPLIPYIVMSSWIFQWTISGVTLVIFGIFYYKSIRLLYE